MRKLRSWWSSLAKIAMAGICLVMIGAGISAMRKWLTEKNTPSPRESEIGPRLVHTNTLLVPEETQQALGLQMVAAQQATRPLEFPPLIGSLAMDPNRLVRVNARFAGEIVEMGETLEAASPPFLPGLAIWLQPVLALPGNIQIRPIRFGDKVKKGQLLAVVWSKDLGEKKSELVDALCQEHLDKETLQRLRDSFKEGAIPEARLREAQRNLQSSQIAVTRAQRTLAAWRLSKAELDAIQAEALDLIRQRPNIHFDRSWARVEVRAPQDGTVLEKNINVGDMVDTSTNLFKIADLSCLSVWAHIYEEDLPALQSLPQPISWKIGVNADPTGSTINGTIQTLGNLVDPVQHTVLASGVVDNPGGTLRPGQFITAHIDLPRPRDEVEIPTRALVQDGEQSAVFVQCDPKQPLFTLRPVAVTLRYKDVIHVRSRIPDHLAGTCAPLLPGERVVCRGATNLRQALENLQNASTEQRD